MDWNAQPACHGLQGVENLDTETDSSRDAAPP